jgi:hypothetical protein
MRVSQARVSKAEERGPVRPRFAASSCQLSGGVVGATDAAVHVVSSGAHRKAESANPVLYDVKQALDD